MNSTRLRSPTNLSPILFVLFWLTASVAFGANYTVIDLRTNVWRYNDSGIDPDPAWRAPTYDDSTWAIGRGVFARENNSAVIGLTNTVLALTNEASEQAITTFYFRTRFQLTNDPEAVSLTFSNLFDDGAVVYLNGTELYRLNMPSGQPVSVTLAAKSATEGIFVITNLMPESLQRGENVLAVEVHQVNRFSDDAVMGLSITASPLSVTPLWSTSVPNLHVIEEGKPLSITATTYGSPAYFQWWKNGVAIPGATARTFEIQAMSLSDTGAYRVVVTNSFGAVTSGVANVKVTLDTNAPVLLDADKGYSTTTVLATFSEALAELYATNRSNYRITNTLTGAFVTISKATLTNGTNVLLATTPMTPGQNYILVVNNLRDTSLAKNAIPMNSSIPVSSWVTLFPMNGTTYDYYQPQYAFIDVPDQGTAWKEPGFSIPNYWPQGQSPFEFTIDSPGETPLTPLTYLGESEFLTSYFRSAVSTNISPAGARVLLRHVVDDGAVFYLNGSEVHRYNMPAAQSYATPSLSPIGKGELKEVELPSFVLRHGNNVLAAEVHQYQPFDENIAFGAQLDVRAQSFVSGPVVITGGPWDATVTEGQPVEFSASQAGGLTFQWQVNGTNVPGATNATFRIPAVPIQLNNAQVRVTVSTWGFPSRISSNATVRVQWDTNPPALLGAWINFEAKTITLSFCEPITAASAMQVTNYVVTNALGTSVAISSAMRVDGTNVVLSFTSLPSSLYTVRVSNIRDTSVNGNRMSWARVLVGYDAFVQPMSGTWRYDDQGIDRGTNWTLPGYDDTGWTGSGAAALGTNRNSTSPHLIETLRTGLKLDRSAGTGHVHTYYFRSTFSAFACTGTLTMRTIVDDGCIVYLNGKEIYRAGMALGQNTYASRNVEVPVIEGPISITVTNLRDGTNVIAVEVHQASPTSSDIYWAGEFHLSIPTSFPPIIIVDECTPIAWSPPVLRMTRGNTNLIFSWVNPITGTGFCPPGWGRAIFMLQGTPEWKVAPYDPFFTDPIWRQSSGPNISVWTDLTTNSPYIVPVTNSMRFFRLKQVQ